MASLGGDGSRDPRDVGTPVRDDVDRWRHYKRNRAALKGFQRALEMVDELVQNGRVYTRSRNVDSLSYRIVDALTRAGALDVLALGEDVMAEEETEQKQRRSRQRQPPER